MTREQAKNLIDTYCIDEPPPDAVERLLRAELSFDPIANRHWTGDQQDEVDEAIYGEAA